MHLFAGCPRPERVCVGLSSLKTASQKDETNVRINCSGLLFEEVHFLLLLNQLELVPRNL